MPIAHVIGGGPVGLSTALLLAHQGIRSVVFEQRTSRLELPRAHVINPRSLEIYRAMGLDIAEMTAQATPFDDDHTCWFTTRVTETVLGSLPFEIQDDTFTPTPRINLAQPKLERILLEQAAASDFIEIRTGHRVAAVRSHNDHAELTVDTGHGRSYTVASPYALACDGAGSAVRESLDVGLHGDAEVQPCLTIHFEGNLREVVADRPGIFYWAINAELPGIFIAYDIERTWVYIVFGDRGAQPTEEQAYDIVTDALGTRDAKFTVRHVLPWWLTAQVADHYRDGRVFLLGDAAHRFPPSGGLGLNTGIQDAHNLAWKIRAMVHGYAGSAILDSYEAERQPVADHNTEQSMRNAEVVLRIMAHAGHDAEVREIIPQMYEGLNSLGMQLGFGYGSPGTRRPSRVPTYEPSCAVGARLPHAWITDGRSRRSTLDLLDPRAFTLLAGRRGAAQWSDVDFGAVPVTTVALPLSEQIPQSWLSLVDIGDDGAMLVRPDGHILKAVRAGGTHSTNQLRRHLFSYLDADALMPSALPP
jgi:2-polyprenyl-6-methoxyphenol hydroxylase-like FAD-dependent oxidoreductase